MNEGDYQFSFSGNGYIEVNRQIYIDGRSNYLVEVDLRETLPKINPIDVGRTYEDTLTIYDLKKEESIGSKSSTLAYTVFFVGSSIGAVGTINNNNPLYVIAGGIAAKFIAVMINRNYTKRQEIVINRNIEYNKTVLPKEIKEKNIKIKMLNEEISKLLIEEQKKKYIKESVKIKTMVN